MFIGIDLGTTDVKCVLVSGENVVVATKRKPLAVSRPQPLWSEQNPHEWRDATFALLDEYAAERPELMAQVQAVGLSGQMHGAVLLDKCGEPLRPAMLWNDGRSEAECFSIKQRVPNVEKITGNPVMPGFTAPKVEWVRRHEPDVFCATDKILLPKDYLRYVLSGDFVTECSDASGTCWLDVQKRKYSDVMLAACGLTQSQMPQLIEGSQVSGELLPELAKRWNMPQNVALAGGGGDNAASAVGIGATQPNEGFVSLGTSGVVFLCSDYYYPNPSKGIHSFCHALPNRWHQMSVMLSAASGLRWACGLLGFPDEIRAIRASKTLSQDQLAAAPIFLPYLCGERTPHNNPLATGMFFGLNHHHGAADIIYSVVEGVGFGLADGFSGLKNCRSVKELSLVGGGARSKFWAQLLANIFDVKMVTRSGSEEAGAVGAARLAQLALGGSPSKICVTSEPVRQFSPEAERRPALMQRYARFHELYDANKRFYVAA